MRPNNIRNFNYKDNLARQHRRHFLIKIFAIIVVAAALLAGLVYFLFFSKIFEVRGISLNGLNNVDGKFVYSQIDKTIATKTAGYLKIQSNILFFNSRVLRGQLLSQEAALKDVRISKKLFHDLVIDFTERKPIGAWCFASACYYFDEDRNIWGNVSKSSGFLMLSVQDDRDSKDHIISEDFFADIKKVSDGLSKLSAGIKIKNILIPADSFNEFRVYTDRNYYILFALDSDLDHQIDILNIFLNDKDKDPAFNPQYLDLRIDGRVYYK